MFDKFLEGQLHARMRSLKLIHVDRPFLVFIYTDDLALFTGRIVNPISNININDLWRPNFIFKQNQIIFPED